jgi:hypothetical protein
MIQKALTSATGVGEALIPENLEQIVTDTVIRMSPELALIESKKISGKTHEFNRLNSKPARGGAMGENATTPVSQSATSRQSVELKIVRRKGKVTNFLKDTSQKYIDAAAFEMENHLQAHVLDLIYYILYGNKDSHSFTTGTGLNQPGVEFDGLDRFISTNRTNEAIGGVVPTNLNHLDTMIDSSNRKGGSRHRRVFGMSPEMLSKHSQLLTNVRLNQGLISGGLTQVDIDGGWRLNAYRDIPIIETTAVAPVAGTDGKMNATITYADVATGGSLTDNTYYLRVAPVTLEGEQEASDITGVIVNGGGAAQSITISLNRPHQTNSVDSALSYKIYGSTTSGSEVLIKWVSAFLYDAELAPLSTNGDNGVDQNIVITSMTPGTDVPTGMQADRPLEAVGSYRPEIIYLWDLDPIQGLGKFPYTNDGGSEFQGLVTTEQLAKIDDYIHFLVKSYPALVDSFEATSCWHRGLRVA